MIVDSEFCAPKNIVYKLKGVLKRPYLGDEFFRVCFKFNND